MMVFLRLLCLGLLLVIGAGAATLTLTPPAIAQNGVTLPDYERWERAAIRAEDAIDAGRASTAALETLRAELAEWRQQFISAQGINANAIATVRDQLNALGPVPEEGEEAVDIARQRAELNERLINLEAPVKTAQIAQTRAEGLIRGIDTIISERQSRELLELSPSPINPVNWPKGLTALQTMGLAISSEIRAALNNPVQSVQTRARLPFVVIAVVVGLLLLVRGRHWSRRLTNWALGEDPGALRWILAFVASLGSILLPYVGYFMLAVAVLATNLLGLRGEQVLNASLGPVFAFLLASWLAMRIFPQREARTLPLNLDPAQRRAGRLYGASLGLVGGVYFFLSGLSEKNNWNEAAANVILFPFIVMAALMLIRLARLLKAHRRNELAEHGTENLRTQISRFIATAMVALSVVSPVLAAVGYFNLAHFLMFPALLSLEIIAALLVLQRLVVEIYVAITSNREGATESLVPVLVGMFLVLFSLPMFALAWGARPAQLLEIWTRFTEGVSLGGVRISPTVFLTFLLVFAIGYIATRLLQGALKNTVLPKTKLDQGGRNAVVSGVGYIGLFLAALIAITSAGLDLSSIAIVAGALSVGIGFGLRTIVENFVSGIILLIERPISEGDWIEVGGVHGTVRSISVRSTRIETFDRSDVILPNADLVAGRVTNYTRFNTVGRIIVPVGVAYGSDTRKVERILLEIAESHPMVLVNPAPTAMFRGFGADSMDFEIRAILRDVNWVLSVHSEMNHQIAERFAQEGIEVPFAQRDIWIRNPEAFSGQPPKAVKSDPEDAPKPESDESAAVNLDGDGAGDGGSR